MRKIALITGGTSGIGFGAAKKAAAMGYDLYLIYRKNHLKAENAKANLLSMFPEIQVTADSFDLSENIGVELFLQKLDQVLIGKKLEVFVSCHGRSLPGLFIQQKFEEILNRINEHLISNIRIMHKILPKMCLESYGRVVFISSLSAYRINRGQADYALSKAALEIFVKSLSSEYYHRNVTFNCVSPGIALTEITESSYRNLDEKTQKMFVPVDQISEIIAMLIDKKTTHISGSTFRIDGGQDGMNNNLDHHKIKFHIQNG